MTEITSVSGTLSRSTKQSDTVHPHYFNSFQNYCGGPKAKLTSTSTSTSKDLLPITENFQKKSAAILEVINRLLVERLPNLTQYTSILPYEVFEQDRVPDFQRYLIDRTMYKVMTETRVINWMPSLKKLYPVRTSGNGNCLLHAVLIAMVGVHDFNLHLRDRLFQFMHENKAVLKGSWKAERLKTDKMYGIQTEDPKLDSEWEELCDLVRYENSDDGQTTSNLQFLEGVHIFSISNMLARPIIILSEDVVRNKHGEAISYNDLLGIYLPILSRPQDCVATPIVLAYDQSHFCPLQSNDKDTGTLADNYLPLYQSVEHIKNQTLLPIRFLGDEGSPEEITKLLNTYLHIKKLSYYPDSQSAPFSVISAELDSKHLSERENFFLVYYDYLVDFFDAQKRKLQLEADEEEDRRKRDQDYYLSSQPLHDSTQRTVMKTNISTSSSPPPPPYSSISTRTNENKNNYMFERRSSYDKAINDGTSYGSYKDTNRNYTQGMARVSSNNGKQLITYPSNWDSNLNERMSDGKITSNFQSNSRNNDSKVKQEQLPLKSVRIPIDFKKSDPPSNLIDFDQKTDKIRPCIVCKQFFHDQSSTGICFECNRHMKHHLAPPRYMPVIRAPQSNIYPTSHRHSDFIAPLPSLSSSSSRMNSPHKIICRHCKNVNMIPNTQYERRYTCSVCQTTLPI